MGIVEKLWRGNTAALSVARLPSKVTGCVESLLREYFVSMML